MKKYIPLLLALLLLTTAACSAHSAPPQPSATPSSSDASPDAQTYTGILEEDKGFMIIVAPEDEDKEGHSDSYVFGTGGITVDAKVGDKIIVTYTGDINDIDGSLEATKVEVVK